MSLDFPWQMFLGAQQEQNRNQQQMNQDISGIGQGLGAGWGAINQAVKAHQQKQTLQQLMAAMNTNGLPQQGPPMAPMGYPQPNISQIPPGQPMSAGGNIGQDVQMPQSIPTQGPGQPTSGMGAPAQDNNKLIQSLMMKLDPQSAIAAYYKKEGQRPTSPWRVVPGMLTPDGNPLQQNEINGEVRPVNLKVTPTGRGNSSFGNALKWNEMPPEIQNLGKEIYENHIQLGKLGYRERSQGVLAAIAYGQEHGLPPFKSYGADVAGKTAEAFATGKPGLNVLGLNTALGHVDSAYEAYKNIQNTDNAWLNRPLNALRKSTNDPNVIKLGLTLNALRGELASVFKGSSGTDMDAKSWHDYLTENLTPDQINAAIPQIDELLRSRLGGLENMRSSGMSGRGEAPLLSPHGAEISKKFQEKNKPVIENGWVYTPGLGGKANKANWKQQ